MKKPCPGYTLIELLIVISIIGIIFVLSLAYYNQFNRKQILDQAASKLKSEMRLTQSKALSGEKPSVCSGAALFGHRLIFTDSHNYKIVVVCDSSEYDIKTGLTLGDRVSKQSGPDSILFKVLGQGTDFTGNIVLEGFGLIRTIRVTSVGEIQ